MGENPLFLLTFLSLFHFIGAAAVGNAVRGWWKMIRGEEQISVIQSVFFAVWGTMFGCIPFGFGADPTQPGWFLPAEISIWLVAFVFAGIFGKEMLAYFRPLGNIHVLLMGLGGIFLAGGLMGGWVAFTRGDVWLGLILGVVFLIIGGGMFALGLAGLLKDYG